MFRKVKSCKKISAKYSSKILRISTDKFFKVYNEENINNKYGWESPHSIRWDRIIYSIKKLKSGESTHVPSNGWTEVFDKKVYPNKIIILEGFLIFTNKELLPLMDLKIFVDVSDINILYRRTLREGTIDNMSYTMDKVIPISKKYEDIQREVADIIIDGNKSKDDVLNDFEKIILKYIK